MDQNELSRHQFYMRKCIELAKVAKARGDSSAGSIIVSGDSIIGEGIEANKTQNDITYHAEIVAIRDATKKLNNQDLSGCILYTTHEPCIMCSYVIRHSKIDAVVVGLATGELGGISSHFPVLVDDTISTWEKPPTVLTGILEEECQKLQH